MAVKDKKMAVLQRLNQQATFIHLPDLLKKLPREFAERSVRRWLVELIKEGLVEKQGEKRGTQYRAIQPIESLIVDRKEIFQPVSKTVLEQIKKPLYERKPVTYHTDWLDTYKPNITFYMPLEIRTQL